MGVVSLCTLVEQGCIAFVIRTIALIEILRSSGHIDESHTNLGGQLLHLIAVVHRMVISSQLLTGLEDTIDNGIVLVSQIVLTCLRDSTSIEVATTDS